MKLKSQTKKAGATIIKKCRGYNICEAHINEKQRNCKLERSNCCRFIKLFSAAETHFVCLKLQAKTKAVKKICNKLNTVSNQKLQ
jgi:hypothetical protein